MFVVRCPDNWWPEREYIIHVVLGDRLGLEYEILPSKMVDYVIQDATGRQLSLPDLFFPKESERWLHPDTLPRSPLTTVHADDGSIFASQGLPTSIPVLYGSAQGRKAAFRRDGNALSLNIDIFGSAFFLLARYEELVIADRDAHGRFPAEASVSAQDGFLERPLADEYVSLLWTCMKLLWPRLNRPRREFQVRFSYDVDRPFRFRSPTQVARGVLRSLRDQEIGLSLLWLQDAVRTLRDRRQDPFLVGYYDLLALLSKLDTHGVFNFMAATSSNYDSGYDPTSSLVREAIERGISEGHEIAFHPGYETHGDAKLFSWELKRLEAAVGRPMRGGRQHYLRFSVPDTWRTWAEAGLEYDSTVGWAKRCGFRAGTSIPFPVFDIQQRRRLSLIERPLIVMDSALQDESAHLLDPPAAREKIMLLADRCRAVGGEFVILWHNSSFWGPWHSLGSIYTQVAHELAQF